MVNFGEAIQLLLRKQRIKIKLVGSMPHIRFPMLTTVCKVSIGEEFSLMTRRGSRYTC